ncbi:MAG: PhnD/SsuA/transferrin family substrate-binding protein [Pseudomonadota bacterium]
MVLTLGFFSPTAYGDDVSSSAQSGSSASAETNFTVLRVGVTESANTTRSGPPVELFRQALSEAISLPVEVIRFPNLPTLIDAFATGRIHYAKMSALGYLSVNKLCDCAQPFVSPTIGDGFTGQRSVLVTVASEIEEVSELEGKPVGLGDVSQVMVGTVPRAEFTDQGTPLPDLGFDLQNFQTLETAIDSLKSGQFIASFGWTLSRGTDKNESGLSGRFARSLEAGLEMEPRMLWQSQHYPFGPHILHKQVPEETVRRVRSLMLGLHTTNPFAFDEVSGSFDGPFNTVPPNDYTVYGPVFETIRRGSKANPTD